MTFVCVAGHGPRTTVLLLVLVLVLVLALALALALVLPSPSRFGFVKSFQILHLKRTRNAIFPFFFISFVTLFQPFQHLARKDICRGISPMDHKLENARADEYDHEADVGPLVSIKHGTQCDARDMERMGKKQEMNVCLSPSSCDVDSKGRSRDRTEEKRMDSEDLASFRSWGSPACS